MSSLRFFGQRALERLTGSISHLSRGVRTEYKARIGQVELGVWTAQRDDVALADRIRHEFGGDPTGASSATPTGDGPLRLKGVDTLRQIADRYGDSVVFHGSPLPLKEIEPRQSSWKRGLYPDGDPAVCADKTIDIPMFMSMFKGRQVSYESRPDGSMIFRVKGLDTGEVNLDATVGYVHVLRRSDFSEVRLPLPEGYPGPLTTRPPELRAFTSLQPLAVVEVRATDFPSPILPK